MGLLGILLILLAAYGLSKDRAAIQWRIVYWGLGLQCALAVLLLKTPARVVFEVIGAGFNSLMGFAEEGSKFVFGAELGSGTGAQGVIIAFQVLPLIIFVASFFAVLYYLGVMQRVVRVMALAMQKTLGVSGAEALNVAANVFMGQSEAPLTIRPYLDRLTRSELMSVMTGGMATISGALMVAYTQISGVPVEHLLTAVVISAPGCIMLAKIMVPETGEPETRGSVPTQAGDQDSNIIDAAARGAGEGLYLSLQVGAMLVAFVGLVALLNGIMGGVRDASGLMWLPPNLQTILGFLFAPVAFVIGVPWADALAVGNLLGLRMVLNEFLAYVDLAALRENLDPRSFLIAGYALCGFANFGSIGVQVGGLGSLIPKRRSELAELGLLAMAAGMMANFLTASMAGLLT
ncbi:MAG: NupC/NupG family nucleoside CNT transporter [Acidobacteria bacterium]|nr:NupC/NupG family nucleoside CNT transporter [Acidobacteriota bacterium]